MDIQTLLDEFLIFLNDTIVPFLLVVAIIVVLWYLAQYFIIQGASSEGQEKAKQYLLWSILGFVIIISLWGIVNLLALSLGFDNRSILPDYECMKRGFSDCRGELDTIFEGDIEIPPDMRNTS